jgi:protein O-mannosyl-transferase
MESAGRPGQNRPDRMASTQPQKHPAGPDGRGHTLGMCVLLAVAVFLVFGRTLRYDFVNYDDDVYFYANPHVQAGLTWPDALWAFTTGYNGNWHPLTWLSFMLDVELFGTGPAGPHLTNVLLHAANTVLLFLVLRRLPGLRAANCVSAAASQAGTLWPSAFVAALFAIHPLHVESVAWVSERKDVMSGLFFMLTILCYARWVQGVTSGQPSPGFGTAGKWQVSRPETARTSLLSPVTCHLSLYYWLAVFFFALGLMSKPMLVTVPFVLLLLDWWPIQRFDRSTIPRLFLEKLPFILLSAFACVATILAQPHSGVRIEKIPLDSRIENAVAACLIYLEKLVYPARLTVFYPCSPDGMSAGKATLGIVLLAGVCLGFFLLRRKRPYLLAGWLWYLGMLVPVIGLMQIARHAWADRYTYLPQIGLYLLVAWAIKDLLPSWRFRRWVFGVVAAIVIAALMVGAAKQTSYWRNSESLWTHALACTTGNYIAHNNLALVLAAQGQSADAVSHFQQALEINPRFVEAHNNLGVLLARQGQSAEPIRHFQKALELQPDCADACNSMGNVLADQGQLTEAITYYQKAIEFKPDFAAAHYNLGNALALQGKYIEAIGHFQKALQIRPDDANTRNSLDAALALQSQSVKETGKQSNP